MKLGGAETHIITLSKALERLGYNVWIIGPNGPAVKWIKDYDLKFINLPLNKLNTQIESIFKLTTIIEDKEIDIIHTHPFNSQIVSCLSGYITNTPVVTTVHGAYWTSILRPEVGNLTEKVICVSKETLYFYRENGIPYEKSSLIPNAVSIKRVDFEHRFFENNKIKILYISRLDNDKIPSLMSFLEAVPELHKRFDLEINIIGDGEKYKVIQEIVDKINTSLKLTVINMIGGTTETEYYIKKSDIVIGVGRVILEAIALGRFAICLGNNYYPGLVDKELLLKISEVNFTDRNSKRVFNPVNFIDDTSNLVMNLDYELDKLKETYEYVVSKFSDRVSAIKHEECYHDVINNYVPKENLGEHWDISKNISEELGTLLPNKYKKKYNFTDAKKVKILLMPNFLDENDEWIMVLNKLLKLYTKDDPVTIIIRISNEYSFYIESIIETLNLIFMKFDVENTPDVLLDMEYHDYKTEAIFLSSVDYFIKTNDSQNLLVLKHKLTGNKTLTIEDLKDTSLTKII